MTDAQIRWWCEWCGEDFYAPATNEKCKHCKRGIDEQVDPQDDDIGVYPMGQKSAFKKARRKEQQNMATKTASKTTKTGRKLKVITKKEYAPRTLKKKASRSRPYRNGEKVCDWGHALKGDNNYSRPTEPGVINCRACLRAYRQGVKANSTSKPRKSSKRTAVREKAAQIEKLMPKKGRK